MAKVFPDIELSDVQSMSQDTGNEAFIMGDNYASIEQKPANKVRQKWTWIWAEITQAQAEELRVYFSEDLNGDYILWTPPGQSTELKWRPISKIGIKYSGFDNATFQVSAGQVFDNA